TTAIKTTFTITLLENRATLRVHQSEENGAVGGIEGRGEGTDRTVHGWVPVGANARTVCLRLDAITGEGCRIPGKCQERPVFHVRKRWPAHCRASGYYGAAGEQIILPTHAARQGGEID